MHSWCYTDIDGASTKEYDLKLCVKSFVRTAHKWWPHAPLAWSGYGSQKVAGRIRKRVNAKARQIIESVGGVAISHNEFRWNDHHLFRSVYDNVHLSEEGKRLLHRE